MYLKSVDGKILFEGRFSNVRQGVEQAVEKNVDLTFVDLRAANLSGAQMDRAQMPYACLWGANLNGANMAEGNFKEADFRTANFLDTCLAEADCSDANFDGSYFSRTILTHSNLQRAQFSCPSIFTTDLSHTATMQGAIYSHLGEVDCDLSHAPLIIQGLPKPVIFMDDCLLIGSEYKKIALREIVLAAILEQEPIKNMIINQ